MTKGRLRIYLGVAPGAGATHAALDEAHRRVARGRTVLAGIVDAAASDAVGLSPLGRVGRPDAWDASAVIAASPSAVVVDDLAATLPGDPGRQRWQVIDALLAAGIDVIGSTDVTSVSSLADEVERFTGRRAPVVPDAVLTSGQLELVDLTPEALRRRLAHGVLLQPGEVDAESARQFSLVTLRGLRELALNYVLTTLRAQHPDARPIVVAVSGGRNSESVVRRGVRAAANEPGASVLAVEVVGTRAAHGDEASAVVRTLAESLGAEYRQVVGTDVARALLDAAETVHARRIIIGASSGGLGVDVAADLVRLGRDLEIDVVPGSAPPTPQRTLAARFAVTRRRTAAGGLLAVLLPGATTWLSLTIGSGLGLPAITMLHLLAVVVVSVVGGLMPAIVAALVASTLLNYWFIPPLHSLMIGEPHNVLAVGLFLVVAVLVSAVVERAARESARAAASAAESQALLAFADARLRDPVGLPGILEHARTTFAMDAAALLERRDGGWTVVDAAGTTPPQSPQDADVSVPAGESLVLALKGRSLAASDQVVLRGLAAHLETIIERDRLAEAAAEADRLKATESLRDALLAAVGHDLRRPLAAARASVDGLKAPGLSLSDAERAELLDTADSSLDRLTGIVDDLLDLSRLQTGALRVAREPVWLDDVIPPALDDLGDAAAHVVVKVAADLPPALGDAALVRRIVANLVANALGHGVSGMADAPDAAPIVAASALGDRVELRVIDRGPGLTAEERERVFLPFQRRGDADERTGLGLGLALSRGLAEAMDGSLEPEDTPGGGLTVVLTLPVGAPEEGA